MNMRGIARSLLSAFVLFSLGWWAHAEFAAQSAGKTSVSSPAGPDAGRKVVAYYFHGNVRCESCVNIEKFSREAIEEGFPEQLASGLLEYRVVNVQKPENMHYFDDYKLSSWALVVVNYQDGKQTMWKNLDKVWEYVLGDQSNFHGYVRKEVQNFLAVGA